MNKTIAVLPGDGIGPEVIEQAIRTLDAIAERFGHQFHYQYADIGAIAIERFGDPLPNATLETCLNADAVLLGAVGHPKYDNQPNAEIRPEKGLLRLRKGLGVFANLRPVIQYTSLLHLSPLKKGKIEGLDFVIYREFTGGIYFGEKKRTATSAYDVCHYEEFEIDRIARLAFEAAENRRGKLTLVDKSNVLESSKLWRSMVMDMAKDYPKVELDLMYADNAAMQIILDPCQFDVILTSNLFGDLISEEASILTGSMGLLPSASIGAETSLFEPVHGSYPQVAGKDVANPMATILSAALMLESFGLEEEAMIVKNTVKYMLEKGVGTQELDLPNIFSCSHIGDFIAYLIAEEDIISLRDSDLTDKNLTII